MKLSDTRIHQIELLLTLDYLLRFTDEKHPATQQDICRHANNFGLKYDSKEKRGNDVRRQRIADCLKFLMEITTKFPDEAPFILERKDSGKYYIEQKNYLNEDQIIKILAAVENDKYTKDEDTDYLIERLLDSLSNVYNREYFKKELDKFSNRVWKYNTETNRKIRVVNKAYNESKMLKIRYEIRPMSGKGAALKFDCWYRVYKIKEFNNKPYALLIPVYTGNLRLFEGYIFEPIEELKIPKGRDKEILCDDFDENRDLDKLFREKSYKPTKHYNSPEDLLKENIMPISGAAYKVGFYVRKPFLKFVKPSFEQFFSTKFDCVPCSSFEIREYKDIDPKEMKEDYIVPHKLKEGEEAKFFVVNTYIDSGAFHSWLVSDVHGNGNVNISDMVEVVGPKSFNRSLYRFYIEHAKKYIKCLDPEDVEKINKDADRYL